MISALALAAIANLLGVPRYDGDLKLKRVNETTFEVRFTNPLTVPACLDPAFGRREGFAAYKDGDERLASHDARPSKCTRMQVGQTVVRRIVLGSQFSRRNLRGAQVCTVFYFTGFGLSHTAGACVD